MDLVEIRSYWRLPTFRDYLLSKIRFRHRSERISSYQRQAPKKYYDFALSETIHISAVSETIQNMDGILCIRISLSEIVDICKISSSEILFSSRSSAIKQSRKYYELSLQVNVLRYSPPFPFP
jgi:hypothetical protein